MVTLVNEPMRPRREDRDHVMSQCMGVHAFGSVVATIKTPKNHKHV